MRLRVVEFLRFCNTYSPRILFFDTDYNAPIFEKDYCKELNRCDIENFVLVHVAQVNDTQIILFVKDLDVPFPDVI